MSVKQNSEVTVVIPSYNHAKYIVKCLKSVLNQSLAPLELLVIDDGSNDNSVELIKQVLEESSISSELIIQENKGLCRTLNLGLSKARGEFFAYLGSDDVWLSTFLEKRTKMLNETPNAVLAYGNSYIIDSSDNIIGCSKDWKNYYAGKDTREKLLYHYSPTSTTVVYRRSFLEKHQWNPQIKLEDYDLYLRLSTEGEFIFDEETLSCWRTHGKNTSNNTHFMFEEIIASVKRNSQILNLSPNELKRITDRKYFQQIDNLIADGNRLKAFEYLITHLSGRSNSKEALNMFIKTLTPSFLLALRNKNLSANSSKKYASIDIFDKNQHISGK